MVVSALGIAAVAGALPATAAPAPISAADAYVGRTDRLAGEDRVATAIAASRFTFPSDTSAPAAVITTSATYADALAGAALAAKVGGPLLLTSPTTVEPAVASEIRRVVKAGGTIYVLGDAGAVTGQVEKTLAPAFTVTRLAGADRYATALAVADQMRKLGAKGPAYLASGANYPDGLTVSTLAARTDGLVILSAVNEYALPVLDAATREWIERDDPTGATTVPVGGPAAAAAAITIGLPASVRARAIIGVDRYDTSRRVADAYGPFPDVSPYRRVGLATGENWPDALVGAAVMGHLKRPLLLTDGTAAQLSPFTARAVQDLTQDDLPAYGLAFGGADVLPDALVREFDRLLPSEDF